MFRDRGRGISGVLRPDATLIGRTPSGRSTAVIIDYDRTRRASKQRERLRRYDDFLCWGWRHSRYGACTLAPLLIVVCSTDAQLPTFIRAIDEELTGWQAEHPDATGQHRYYPALDLVGVTSRQRLLAGNSKIVTPSVLPHQRQHGRRSLGANEIDLPVHRLLAAGPVGDAS